MSGLFRYTNRLLLFITVLFLTLPSCSNWSDNPETSKKDDIVIVNQGFESDVWHSVNFPVGTTAFYPYTKDLIFAGTAEGNLYVSYDNCTTWSLATLSTKNKAPIKCIKYDAWKVGSIDWSLAIACSDRGIYRSKDKGISWYEITDIPDSTGKYEVNTIVFSNNLSTYSNNITTMYQRCVISGKYNGYNVMDWYFNSQETGTQDKISFTKTYFAFQGVSIRNLYYFGTSYYCSFTDSSSGHIFAGGISSTGSGRITNIGLGNEVNAFVEIPSQSYTTIIAATKTGLIVTQNNGNQWTPRGSDTLEFKFLKKISAVILFAGNQKGLFISTNQGMNWRDISSEPGTPIEDMELSTDGYLYIKKSNNEYLFIKTNSKTLSSLYPPILSYPENNSAGIDTNVILEWRNWMKVEPSFWVQISTKSNLSSDLILDKRYIKGNKCNLTGIKSKTKYYWRIRSETLYYQTDWSEIWEFTTK